MIARVCLSWLHLLTPSAACAKACRTALDHEVKQLCHRPMLLLAFAVPARTLIHLLRVHEHARHESNPSVRPNDAYRVLGQNS